MIGTERILQTGPLWVAKAPGLKETPEYKVVRRSMLLRKRVAILNVFILRGQHSRLTFRQASEVWFSMWLIDDLAPFQEAPSSPCS